MNKTGDVYTRSNSKGAFNYIVIKSTDTVGNRCFLIYENKGLQNGEHELNLQKNRKGEMYFYFRKDASEWIKLQEQN